MGQTALLREAVIVYFNQRRTPVKVSTPPFQGLLLVVAVGRFAFTQRPKRGSEPHNNAEWIWIKIAALVSYYAVCSVFALGPVFFFFKGIYIVLKMKGSFCSAPRVPCHHTRAAMWKNKAACIFRIEPKQNSEEKKNARVRNDYCWEQGGIITCWGSKEKRIIFPLLT